MGMAERGMLPLALAKRSSSRYGGAPIPATLLSATGILFLSFLDFNQLVEILNCLYAVAQLLYARIACCYFCFCSLRADF